MLYCFRVLLFLTFFSSVSHSSVKTEHSKPGELLAKDILPYGRYSIDNNRGLELISSAVHFGFSFTGSECAVYFSLPGSGDHNYLQYELDGVYQKRLRIKGGSVEPLILKATKQGKHSIWIYKTTEATTGPIYIQRITGQNIAPVPDHNHQLIEFIGNSITCGAAADTSEMPCGSGEYMDHHNAYFAYGPRVARALHANFILSSVSGIGIYRNWNSDGPVMPDVYENTDLTENASRRWNFSTYSPEVVSIALGTNDFSRGDGIKKRLPFDSGAFVSAYIKFVQLVKSKYPQAQIALLSSPMVSGNNGVVFQKCLIAVKQHIDAAYKTSEPIALFFFKPLQPHGCSGHPSVKDHEEMAGELIPFFKKLLSGRAS